MKNSRFTWMRTAVKSGSGKIMRTKCKRERLTEALAHRERRNREREAVLATLNPMLCIGVMK